MSAKNIWYVGRVTNSAEQLWDDGKTASLDQANPLGAIMLQRSVDDCYLHRGPHSCCMCRMNCASSKTIL